MKTMHSAYILYIYICVCVCVFVICEILQVNTKLKLHVDKKNSWKDAAIRQDQICLDVNRSTKFYSQTHTVSFLISCSASFTVSNRPLKKIQLVGFGGGWGGVQSLSKLYSCRYFQIYF